ncbi:MAG: fibrobacter succinogenes major paralogous domain-containing protein, partial [Prevotellaceae bacterium]|nr:fibrobacter succinogenes major paralogous domain-containing protein [Prevotellaceae bacterium]
NTSAVIDYKDGGTVPSYNAATHQVDESSTKYYGKFIYSTGSGAANGDYDWYYNSGSHDNYLWGSSTVTGTNLSSLTFTWDKPSNNPCPSGWRIPSSYNFGNLYRKSNSPTSDPSTPYDANNVNNNNTWAWRAMNTANYAIGGVIITATNAIGEEEKLFLPASGYRYYSNGALDYAGTNGYYCSSTYYSTTNASFMRFYSSNVFSGSYNSRKAIGFSVRCVAEF